MGQFCHLTLKGSVNRNLTGWVGCVVCMEEHLKMNIILLLPSILSPSRDWPHPDTNSVWISSCDLYTSPIIYFQVNDANTMVGTPGEMLSRRCVALLKTALKPDVWPQQCDLKLNWFDKVFASVESGSPNYGNICTALELLTFLLGVMKKEQILASCKPLQRGIAACITCSNSKVRDLVNMT